jgi:GR25 family glycosyltransferase involved in LPS biosynthesis
MNIDMNIDINKYFDRIFIINLKKRSDRKEKMIKRLSKAGISNYEFVEAINGYNEPYLSMYHTKHRTQGFFENPGALGILLSALKVLVWSVKQNYKKILILEDDAVFHLNFKETFKNRIGKIPNDWKLLYFGTSMHKWRLKERCNYNDGYLTAKGSIPGAFAIGIDSSIFKELIGFIPDARKAWDMDPLKRINLLYTSNVYVFYPYIIVCETDDSNIRRSKSLGEKVRTSDWDLSLYDWN